jgi:hypothetical protein
VLATGAVEPRDLGVREKRVVLGCRGLGVGFRVGPRLLRAPVALPCPRAAVVAHDSGYSVGVPLADSAFSLSVVVRREHLARFVVPTVAASVDLVVHLGIDNQGVRRVNEVVAVPGRVENDIIETEPIFLRTGGELRRQGGFPPRTERFDRIGVDVHRILAGTA